MRLRTFGTRRFDHVLIESGLSLACLEGSRRLRGERLLSDLPASNSRQPLYAFLKVASGYDELPVIPAVTGVK